LEDRRIAMPGLREDVIAAICEEWPNSEDELNQVAIHERLEVAGVGASEDDVQHVLLQLANHDDIRLATEAGAPGGLAVVYVDPELCP
jgi:hypothetical protein